MRNDRLIEIVVFTGISPAGSFLFVWTIFFHCPLPESDASLRVRYSLKSIFNDMSGIKIIFTQQRGPGRANHSELQFIPEKCFFQKK
jgi:hypothetical protein